jgi:hypothetical protein
MLKRKIGPKEPIYCRSPELLEVLLVVVIMECCCCLVGEEKFEDTKEVIRGQTTQWSKEKRTKGQITIYKT